MNDDARVRERAAVRDRSAERDPADPAAAPDPAPGLAERRAAAARVLRASPTLSDREVGRAVGLSAGTVSAVRRTLGERKAARVRVGGDGRSRPVSADEGRRAAARLLARRPEAPVREIAREAGISLGTAHDVRRRVLAGLPPVPDGRAAPLSGERPGSAQPVPRTRGSRNDPVAALELLRRDPALRYSETGRMILRRMENQVRAADQLVELCARLPPHCREQIEVLLRHIGAAWTEAGRTVEAGQPRSTERFDG